MSNQAQAPARPPELLAPAGGQEQLEAALRFGSGRRLRGRASASACGAFAGNFDRPALERAVRTAHGLGRRLYVTVNAFLYEQDLQPVAAYLRELEELGVDAAIVSDLRPCCWPGNRRPACRCIFPPRPTPSTPARPPFGMGRAWSA